MVRAATVPAPVRVIMPLVPRLCNANACPVKPKVPVVVMIPPLMPLLAEMLVTVPVPAPIAVRKTVAFSALTLLSALTRKKLIAEGLIRVSKLPPTVVAPCTEPVVVVLWVYAEVQLVMLPTVIP